MTQVYFYIPKNDWLFESTTDLQKVGDLNAFIKRIYTKAKQNKESTICSWILQTYLRLKNSGFPCSLVRTLPSEGIVIAYWGSLLIDFKPSPKLLVISVLADGLYPHPYTQLRIVQNKQQALLFQHSYYMPHWPQPGLVSRNPGRGDRFENIGFFGTTSNLSPELKSPSWHAQLKSLRLNWCVVEHSHWHDYSDIDAIVSVRDFRKNDFIQKPATKLFNAWHAGVPAILGCESAFQAERKNKLDYIEVATPNEVITALKRLRDNQDLRKAMIKNGQDRAKETNITNMTNRWCDFIQQVAVPAYGEWCSASFLSQQSLFMMRFIAKKVNGLSHRWKRKCLS